MILFFLLFNVDKLFICDIRFKKYKIYKFKGVIKIMREKQEDNDLFFV